MKKQNLYLDSSKAFNCFNIANKKGCIEGIWRTSACLIKKMGVEKNRELAEMLLKKGIKKGSVDSLFWFAFNEEKNYFQYYETPDVSKIWASYWIMKEAAAQGHLAAKYCIAIHQYQYRFFPDNIRENGWKMMLEVVQSRDKYFLVDYQSYQFSKPLDQEYEWYEYCPRFGSLKNLKTTSWYKIIEIGESIPIRENQGLTQRKVTVKQTKSKRVSKYDFPISFC
jgi:hypothetical protein